MTPFWFQRIRRPASQNESRCTQSGVMPPHSKNVAGFSLMEVLCAILLLGVGVAGLTHGLATALGSNKESELQTTAALLAASRIELLRADSFIIPGEDEGECGEGLELYRWKQSVTETDMDGLYEVTVTIENTNSDQLIYELKTLLFDPPLPSTEQADERERNDRRREGGR